MPAGVSVTLESCAGLRFACECALEAGGRGQRAARAFAPRSKKPCEHGVGNTVKNTASTGLVRGIALRAPARAYARTRTVSSGSVPLLDARCLGFVIECNQSIDERTRPCVFAASPLLCIFIYLYIAEVTLCASAAHRKAPRKPTATAKGLWWGDKGEQEEHTR